MIKGAALFWKLWFSAFHYASYLFPQALQKFQANNVHHVSQSDVTIVYRHDYSTFKPI